MANIVPFDSGELPAYLKQAPAEGLNEDLTSHILPSFPVMSIKGKVFTLVRGDEKKIIPNPKDPDSPATYIDVVLLKVNKNTTKTYYIKPYDPTADAAPPDCFSRDGITPDPASPAIQAKACATCKHNVFGAKIGENGQKSKACQDNVRMAIAQPNALKDAMLLRVPPATIKPLGEYGKILKSRGVEYQAVLTRVSFEAEAATPKLQFKPIGFLPENAYKAVKEMASSELVQQILGDVGAAVGEAADPVQEAKAKATDTVASPPAPAPAAKSKTVTTEEVKQAVAKAEAKPEPAAKEPEVEIDLDGLNFDD
jgi:hypothetical protein